MKYFIIRLFVLVIFFMVIDIEVLVSLGYCCYLFIVWVLCGYRFRVIFCIIREVG